jgi:hypothetical protein
MEQRGGVRVQRIDPAKVSRQNSQGIVCKGSRFRRRIWKSSAFRFTIYFCSGMIFDLPLIFVVECALTALDQEVHAYMRSTQPMRSHDPVRRHWFFTIDNIQHAWFWGATPSLDLSPPEAIRSISMTRLSAQVLHRGHRCRLAQRGPSAGATGRRQARMLLAPAASLTPRPRCAARSVAAVHRNEF